jgi:FixJ family two-component response regulator
VNLPEPTVFIVDDDPSVREALTSLIRSAGLRVAAFASGREFSEFLPQQHGAFPACLLLDIGLPEIGGFDLQHQLARSGENLPIIFITGHGDIPMSVRAMKAGAIDFLTKPFRDDQLLATIRHALELHEGAQAQHQYAAELRRRFGTLTRREREVMTHVVQGLLNKQVAATLGIAEITIKVHRRRVMQKMKAASLAELVRMGERLTYT